MLLKEIVEKGHYCFIDKELSWQDSIRAACKPLEEKGVCKTQYAEEIISCVSKHGPYIVLVPGLAMPHSTENAEGAIETAIGFMKTEKMVHFLEGDPEKDANVFFTLVSTNPEEHHKNMQRLYTILTNEEALEALKHVKTVEDLLAIDQMLED